LLSLPNHLEEALRRSGTIVVPSRQRAHALRLAHAAAQLAAGRSVWPSPDVLPLEGWLTREVERYAAGGAVVDGEAGAAGGQMALGLDAGRVPRLLSSAEEWLLWRQSTVAATGDLELIDRAALAESLRRASALAAELRIDVDSGRAAATTEAALLAAVHRDVLRRSQALGAAPLSVALSCLPCVGDARSVVFAGFLTPSPRLRSIMAARARGGHESACAAIDQDTPAAPRVVRAADEREELERIAEWCRHRLASQPGARLLIVLPGSAGRRERLAALIRQAVDPAGALRGDDAPSLLGLEGGQPLGTLPLVAHALRSLALLAGEALEIESLLEWLRAPWWLEPALPERARLDLWLREGGRLRFDRPALLAALRRAPSGVTTAATALASRLEQAMTCLRAAEGTPREWSERFRAALAALGWPGGAQRGSAEQQTLLRPHELLDELGQLSAATRGVRLAVAVQWLTELAARTAYRPADDDPAVTLSPVYADPVARYDGVWVAGLHAEAFPQPVAPEPFLPLPAQLAAGWPAASAAGRLQEARALLGAWRAAAAELVLSAPSRAEDIELLPSPLLEEWRTGGSDAPPDGAPGPLWLPARLHRPGRVADWRDDAGVAWSAGLPLPSGTRSLELQNQCPFRAYAELRLGAVELGVPEPGIAPDARGQLLHEALQRLWERLGDSRALAQLSTQALQEAVATCVEEAAAALDTDPRESFAQPALARECRRTARLIHKLLALERERAPFRVLRTEYGARLQLAGQELRLRIDRLDALESGGVAILDYKSGRRASADWYGERPSHPQLLAYLAAIGEDVVAMATINVTAREVRFDGIAASAALLPKVAGVKGPEGPAEQAWRARAGEWRAVVERLAAAFAVGQAVVDPKPRACDYCHVAGVCRVGDMRPTAAEEGDEDVTGGGDGE